MANNETAFSSVMEIIPSYMYWIMEGNNESGSRKLNLSVLISFVNVVGSSSSREGDLLKLGTSTFPSAKFALVWSETISGDVLPQIIDGVFNQTVISFPDRFFAL